MRIRKNANIPPLFYPASSPNAGAVVQTYVCQLNQSPWDVISFPRPPASPPPLPPLPPPQVDKIDDFAGNGCSAANGPVVERKFNADWKCKPIDGGATNSTEEPPHVVKDDGPVNFCCKDDGKSWQCRRNATKGNSLCEHHLSLAKNYNNLNQSKKSEKFVVEAQRRTRPKKASASSSSNPYQFYYYSGFGPNWSRQRSESSNNINGRDVSQNVEHKHELNPSLLLSQFDEDTIDSLDAEEEYENGEKGRKRGRKSIKARLLNSLKQ